MFVRTTRNRTGKLYHYVLESYYDRTKKCSVHRRISDLTGLPQEVMETVRAMLAGKPVTVSAGAARVLSILRSRFFGPVWLALIFWLRLRLDRLPCFSRAEFRNLTALVVGRTVSPVECRSERRTAEWLRKSAMGLIFGNAERQWNRNEFYPLLTKLSDHWAEVEHHLWSNRGSRPKLYLYDITSTYFEGAGGSFGRFGYSRDEKPGNPQIVVALVADERGLPVALRFFPGNTRDSTTVSKITRELKETFGVSKAVIIMDRGMRAEANLEALAGDKLDFVMALKHKEAREFVKTHHADMQWELFDQRSIAEWTENARRYIICRNPEAAKRDRHTRERILQRGAGRLDKLVNLARRGRIRNRDKILARAVKILTQTGTEKYFDFKADTGGFEYWRKQSRVEMEEEYEGCYVLETTLSAQEADKTEVDAAYRNQREIEEIFKSCKDELQMRPNFHIKDANILGHIRLTFLAHSVKKHLELVLQKAGCHDKGSTFLMRFNDVMANRVSLDNAVVDVVTELNAEQRRRLAMAGVSIPTGQLHGALEKSLPKELQGIL